MNEVLPPRLLQMDGTPYPRARADAADGSPFRTRFRGASSTSQEIGGWRAPLTSPAGEMFGERDALVGRIQDIARNNGFVAGIRTTLLDGVIGTTWRLAPRPNWRNLGMDFKTAASWSTTVAAKWRSYAEDPGCWIDAERRQRFGGLLRTQFNTWFLAGEHCAIGQWLPDRVMPGKARFATALQLIDPDRLSNPNGAAESKTLRQGVQLGDRFGEPIGYWFRDAHPADWANAGAAATWTYVPREKIWGRPIVLHGFEVERAGYVRGKPPLSAVVEALFLKDMHERGEASVTVLNALYAATLETEFGADPEIAKEVFGTDSSGGIADPDVDMRIRGVTVPVLPPGVRLKFNAPARPAAAQFQQFEQAVLRRVAAGIGMSYEQVSRDYSQTNYSSARASLLDAWKFFTGRSEFMANTFADPAYALWLEEAVNRGEVELPPGTPDFYEARADWVSCRWIGPGRGWIDPVKEAQAAQMKIAGNFSTLEDENAEQGRDWEEVLEQKAFEQARKTELGVDDSSADLLRVNSNDRGADDRPGKKKD